MRAGAANPATPEPSAQPPLEVRVSHAALSPNVAAVWIAADLGFDREYGLQIAVHQTRTAAMSQAALLAGEIDYAWTGLAPMLGARSGGSDVIFIAATTNRSNAELVVRPPLRTPADLVGKSFGVQSYGGPPHIRTLQALSRLGLDPASATILITGDEGVTTAALLEGVIDGATISYTGAAEPKARGFYSWDLAELGVTEITGIATRPQQVQEKPEATRRLLRALARANAYIHSIDTDATARQRVGEAVGARLRRAGRAHAGGARPGARAATARPAREGERRPRAAELHRHRHSRRPGAAPGGLAQSVRARRPGARGLLRPPPGALSRPRLARFG